MRPPALLLVSSVAGASGAADSAAMAAAALAEPERASLLVEVGRSRPRRPALAATADARELEERLVRECPAATPAARGRICSLAVATGDECLDQAGQAAEAARERGSPCVVQVPAPLLLPLADRDRIDAAGALLRADLPDSRPLTALVVRALGERRVRSRVVKRPPGRLPALLAAAGLPLPPRAAAESGRLLRPLRAAQSGQALPLALGGALVVLVAALAAVAIAGALAGEARVQRAADLIALSATRSLRDDLPRLLVPARLPGGAPNPSHLSRREFLTRAREAGVAAADANGVAGSRVRITFPDRGSFAPLRSRVRIRAELDAQEPLKVVASATAEAVPPPVAPSGAQGPAFASGGGYSGPLVYRQSEGMRPDVAAAYDSMAAAAAAAGVTLVVVSGFRSDAEQAQLFAANPDPRMVAPPGQSLHRCATELDLGPSSAYAWLAGNAERFGFVQRYSWEAWHYGFTAGPAPCSEAGNAVTGPGADGEASAGIGLPSFVPAAYRAPLLGAAAKWGVSASLLAAQLMAESNFDPAAVSPAGAQGIAQFIPSTAAAYGLADPFDPAAAIGAQAHLMSDLLGQFGSPELALAAYNAGPAPVAACSCVPPYPETQAYVARIMALLGGVGALAIPPLEVRLVD